MREQHDEARLLLIQDGAQGEVDLGEAWGAPLLEEGMRQSDICERRRLVGGEVGKRIAPHTLGLYPLCDGRFTRPAVRMSADELEVLRHVVHLLPLQIGDDDEDLVAADIVHPAQDHQLWKLCARAC